MARLVQKSAKGEESSYRKMMTPPMTSHPNLDGLFSAVWTLFFVLSYHRHLVCCDFVVYSAPCILRIYAADVHLLGTVPIYIQRVSIERVSRLQRCGQCSCAEFSYSSFGSILCFSAESRTDSRLTYALHVIFGKTRSRSRMRKCML